jgi:nucleoside-diphosphate-sugar epimerase
MMKVLIRGGGGFIGSWVADRLLQDGHAVRIFERPHVLPYRKFDAEGDRLAARIALRNDPSLLLQVARCLAENACPAIQEQVSVQSTLRPFPEIGSC